MFKNSIITAFIGVLALFSATVTAKGEPHPVNTQYCQPVGPGVCKFVLTHLEAPNDHGTKRPNKGLNFGFIYDRYCRELAKTPTDVPTTGTFNFTLPSTPKYPTSHFFVLTARTETNQPPEQRVIDWWYNEQAAQFGVPNYPSDQHGNEFDCYALDHDGHWACESAFDCDLVVEM